MALRYALGAVIVGAAALGIGGPGWWLLWPAISLASVSGNYAFFGPEGFRKRSDGSMSAAAIIVHAPYMLGAWINSRIWTRNEPAPVSLRKGIMLGRIPSRREAQRFATIIDLCAELPATNRRVDWLSFPMLDFVTPEVSQLRVAIAAIERARTKGPVLVCCALGYSRSVSALTAWLLSSGQAENLDDAIEQMRRIRPRMVLHEDDKTSIAMAASREEA